MNVLVHNLWTILEDIKRVAWHRYYYATMIGIILAGGTGSRLGPITKVTSKQLLPIYDKPMIYYPLALMMASGIREIVIITTPKDIGNYKDLLGGGSQWGVIFHFLIQQNPNGLPEAYLLAEDLIREKSTTLILGDNIVYGSQIARKLNAGINPPGAHVYGYLVKDASSFGVMQLDDNGEIESLIEKPVGARNALAIPGIYHFNSSVVERAKTLKPSKRGELEMMDLLSTYLVENALDYSVLDRGIAWLDTGTIEDLFMAAELVRVLQKRQGMMIGSPDEVAFRNGWINMIQLENNIKKYSGSLYSEFLNDLLRNQ